MISKPSFNRIFLLIAAVSFLLSGCQKLEEYIHHPGNTDYKACNIKKLLVGHTYGESTDTTIYTFSYNWLGNPVSVINDHTGTGNPNYAFFYDNKNRLIQFLQPYTNGFYEKWDKYGYNNKGQIVYDTNYVFGPMPGGIPMPADRFKGYITYEYDGEGRIKHETDNYYDTNTLTLTRNIDYAYDANGNRVTGAVYDNKLSINRTNAVWMFITKDYSVNNPFTAIQYNENRLPLHFTYNGFQLIPAAGGGDINVDYLCH